MVANKRGAVPARKRSTRSSKNSTNSNAKSAQDSALPRKRGSGERGTNNMASSRNAKRHVSVKETISKLRGDETVNLQEAASAAKPIVQVVKEFVPEEHRKEIDGVDRFITMVEKLAPMAQGFIAAMQANAQANQQRVAMQYSAPNAPMGRPIVNPPPGWLEMSPMMRWQHKYDQSGNLNTWYVQGEQYEAYVRGEAPPSLQMPSAPVRAPPQQVAYQQPVYSPPHPPMTYQQPPTDAATSVENAMIQQNETYLNLAASYLEAMSPEQLDKALADHEEVLVKVRPFKALIPVTVALFIKNQSVEAFTAQIAQRAPKTWDHVVSTKQEAKAVALLTALKSELG